MCPLLRTPRVRRDVTPGSAAEVAHPCPYAHGVQPSLTQTSGSHSRSPDTIVSSVRVLVVEDERKLAQVLASALHAEHYEAVVAATGEDGFCRATAEVFDLIILDLMLPGRGGLDILHTLRQRHIQT